MLVIDREWAEITVATDENEYTIYLENEGNYANMDWRFVINE
jgi:hypothetical protein